VIIIIAQTAFHTLTILVSMHPLKSELCCTDAG
jgi:hypothetical protein